jgi:hypothetical protein
MRVFQLFLLFCGPLAMCSCSHAPNGPSGRTNSQPTGNVVATLDTEEYDHNFGEVPADTRVERAFEVRNRTVRTIHVRSLQTAGSSASATMEPMTLGPGDRAMLKVGTQIPEGAGGATVEFVTDGGMLAPRFVLRGIGVRPRASPTALDFGRVLTGQSKTHELKVLFRNSVDLVPKRYSLKLCSSLGKKGGVSC